MKNLLTSFFILCFLPCFSQLGLTAGTNISFFTGKDKNLTGLSHSSVGFVGGLYYEGKLMSPSILYQHSGIRNPYENNRTFSMYSLSLQVPFNIHLSKGVELQVGAFADRLMFCKNWSFEGATFGWSGNSWGDYWKKYDAGALAGINMNLIGVSINVRYKQGLIKPRNGNANKNFLGSYNSGLSVMLQIPFKTFFE